MKICTLTWAAASAILLLSAGLPCAQAMEPLALTLDQNSQTTAPGGTLQFFGTISTNAFLVTVTQGGDSLNPIGVWPAGITADDTPFLSDAPGSLDPGALYRGELFDISVAPGTPFGSYSGTFQIEYNDPVTGHGFFSQQGFEVQVVPDAAPVPEASSVLSLSLLLGLGCTAGLLQKRNTKNRPA